MSKTYSGGCQCGKVRYDVDLTLGEVMACNCSRCGKLGSLFAFAPASDFRMLSGDSDLASYQFNKHNIEHFFCKTCGIQSFAKGKSPKGEMAAINVRCLDDVDVGALTIKHVDGKSF